NFENDRAELYKDGILAAIAIKTNRKYMLMSHELSTNQVYINLNQNTQDSTLTKTIQELETRLRIIEEECTEQRELVKQNARELNMVNEQYKQALTQIPIQIPLTGTINTNYLQTSDKELSTLYSNAEVSLNKIQLKTEDLQEIDNYYNEKWKLERSVNPI